MRITANEIARQYHKIKTRGWLPAFQREAKRAGTSTAHLLAIGSRETNLENIRGDFRGGIYHGAGVLQVDIGTDPNYVRNWTKENWEPSIVRGTDIYRSKLADTLKCVGKSANVRSKTFVGKSVEADDLRRIATAAYNCGRWAHYHFSAGNNVDSSTTGKDYSRDVYDRAIEFAKLLAADGVEPDALRQEIIYQGKYARNSVKSEAGIYYADRVKLPYAPAPDESAAVPASVPAQTDQPVQPDTKPAFEAVPQIPQNVPPPTTEINAPPPDGSTATATKLTIAGFAVPTFLTGIISAIQSAIANGFISAADVGAAVIGFIKENTKYLFAIIALMIVAMAAKKLWKQITLWKQMEIAADRSKTNVEVKPQ